MLRRLHWILPALFLSWIGASLTLLAVFGSDLSVAITNVLSVTLVLFLPAQPILNAMGLSKGEYWALPNLVGFVLVSGLYGLALYGLGRLIQARFTQSE